MQDPGSDVPLSDDNSEPDYGDNHSDGIDSADEEAENEFLDDMADEDY